jgi:hypothetical protein
VVERMKELSAQYPRYAPFGGGRVASLLAVLRRQHLKFVEQLEPHLEHIDVVVVVFDAASR